MARTIAKDHDAKRGQILTTAARVFAEEGFDRASMSQLARACGISKANIYHYYDSKDALLFDMLDSYLSGLRDEIAAVDGTGLSPEDHLYALCRAILMAYRGSDDEHRVQGTALGALPAAEQQILRGYQRDLVDQVSDALQRLSPERLADPKLRRAATMSLFGMLNWFYMWNRDDSDAAREDYARLVTNMVLGGLPRI